MAGKLIDATSKDCLLTELELFQVPNTQTSVERTQFSIFNPITSPDRQAPLDFVINSSDWYLDPTQIWLYTKNKIVFHDGTDLPEQEAPADGQPAVTPDRSIVYPVNNFHSSRFRALDVHLNGRLITPSDNLYPYRAYLETLLTHRPDVAKNQLQLQMFYQDEGGNAERWDETRRDPLLLGTSNNKGAVARFRRTKFSRTFETMGRLHFGLANQEKLLPPNTELRFKLTRAENKFCLMARGEDREYRVRIDKALLYVQLKKVANHVQLAHEEAYLKFNAKYPIINSEIRHFAKPQGLSELGEDNILTNSTLPSKVVVGIVHTTAFSGNNTRNPFCFLPVNVKEITLKINSQPLPFERIQVDFANGCYSQGLFTLLQGTRRLNSDKGFQINYSNYAFGNTLYAFDVTQDGGECDAFNLQKEGNLSLDITLTEPTNHPVTLIVYMEMLKMIEIDRSRNIQVY